MGDKAKAPIVDYAIDVDDVEEVQQDATLTHGDPKSDCASKKEDGNKSNPSDAQVESFKCENQSSISTKVEEGQ